MFRRRHIQCAKDVPYDLLGKSMDSAQLLCDRSVVVVAVVVVEVVVTVVVVVVSSFSSSVAPCFSPPGFFCQFVQIFLESLFSQKVCVRVFVYVSH